MVSIPCMAYKKKWKEPHSPKTLYVPTSYMMAITAFLDTYNERHPRDKQSWNDWVVTAIRERLSRQGILPGKLTLTPPTTVARQLKES